MILSRSMPRNKFVVGSIFSGLFLPRNLRTEGLISIKSSVLIGRNPKTTEKTVRNVAKTTFFSFIFPIPLSYTSRPSFSIVLCANQKLERKTCNTRATLLWPHLSVTLEMLGNLSFTRRNLVNFFVKNLHFFFIEYLSQIYCILSSEWSSKCS